MKKIFLLLIIILIIIGCHQPLPLELRNSKPGVPELLFPANDSMHIPVDLTFKWSCTDPNVNDSLTFDFYLSANNADPALFLSGLTENSLVVNTLNYQTQYYWKIVAFDQNGASSVSPVSTFKTRYQYNVPPNTPSAPQPANMVAGVPIKDVQLNWQGGDPDTFSIVAYDVLFGRSEQLLNMLTQKFPNNSYKLPLLIYNTRYYWQIKAEDNYGSSAEGPVWRFRTVIADSLFEENFETYMINQNPSSLKWSAYEANADLFVTDESSWTELGKSICFTDSTLAGNSFLAAALSGKQMGQLQFYWKVSSVNDFFGVRLYSSSPDTAHVGPQLSIREGQIQYFDKSQIWHPVMSIAADQWYFVQLVFDCSAQVYNIYVDSELKIENAGWVGTTVPLLNQIYFLTFDNRTCQKAFVDEIKYYGQ